jgi:hypothetical protein
MIDLFGILRCRDIQVPRTPVESIPDLLWVSGALFLGCLFLVIVVDLPIRHWAFGVAMPTTPLIDASNPRAPSPWGEQRIRIAASS